MKMELYENNVYAYVPFVDENGEDMYIQILNPNGEQKLEFVKIIVDGLQDKDKKYSKEEVLEYMINNFTNLELEIPLKELDFTKLSFEFKMVLKHLEVLLQQIQQELFMNMRLETMRQLTKEYEELTVEESKELATLRYNKKNPKKKKKGKKKK